MYAGLDGFWGLDWKPRLYTSGKCLPPSQQLLASPIFWFLIKACLSLEIIDNNEEKRKRVYVLKSDSDQLTERLPDPACILQSLPTRLLSVPQLPSCALFILASQRLGLGHQALYDLLLFSLAYFTCAWFQRAWPEGVFPCGNVLDYGTGHVSWTLSLIWDQAAWIPVSECELRSCFRAWCFESSLHSLVCREAQMG